MKNKTPGISPRLWGKALLAGLLLAGALQLPVSADRGTSANVRVAMFLDFGGTFKSTVPAVTLKADSAWGAGLQTGGDNWVRLSAGESARFSVSGYKVKVMESTDWNTVAAAVKKLQATADKPVAFEQKQDGGTRYLIYTGPYASEAEARKAADRTASALSASLKGQQPSVRGVHYASAGSFDSKVEAEVVRASLDVPNGEAFVVLTGPQQYSVWAGGAANEADLAALKGQLNQTAPQLSWTTANTSQPALLIHSDVTLNLAAPSSVDHFELSGSEAALRIGDDEDSLIQVAERSNRKYRGDFEISRYNGQLALVNEVPLEQYLYSVVAAEVPSSWPQESLKAQAVAARSYALFNASANRFKVAGLVDTTLSQVYNGAEKEVKSVKQAVDSTAGEVLTVNGKVIEGIFSSNSGGAVADSSEVWNSLDPVFSYVPSEEDQAAQAGLKSWYYVLLSSGKTGYIRQDQAELTGGSTAAGLKKLTAKSNSVMVRPLPLIQSGVDPVAKINLGDQAIVLGEQVESNAYAWIRGPFSSAQLEKSLKGKTSTPVPSPINSLEVTQRGPSGRVTQVKANGQIVDVKYPDALRSALNGLPSTLFDIVPTGRYTLQGADGVVASKKASEGVQVMTASGTKNLSGGNLVVMDSSGAARVVDDTQAFLFIGKGNGHGLGLSQWGAKGMADAGYDYRKILQHYYQNVTIVKE
ncbi:MULTISPECIES: SpoIID/LytB domain-containing protein [Paenibacillus]|uniref:SpoIID/LytB domain-containing protein n=1 Tax=Paenibacillus TaxID=44249 RepID=UPI002FE23599